MVLTKEYRICMPLTVEEYHIGQLYMIARHSMEQSGNGEGVEVVQNKECEDPKHGKGKYTEKRIHLSSRLPYYIQAMIPKIFYVTEKAWNYYPFTITEYTCSFLPRFYISILTAYENNNGITDNCLSLSPEELAERTVENVDIAYDDVSAKHYKEDEDPRYFQSKKTKRGPLVEGWRNTCSPVMCSYKVVRASFEVWGLQTRIEEFIHTCIREILLVGHRQAFTWVDDWIEMSYADVCEFEATLQSQTNKLIKVNNEDSSESPTPVVDDSDLLTNLSANSASITEPTSPKSPSSKKGGYFSWF